MSKQRHFTSMFQGISGEVHLIPMYMCHSESGHGRNCGKRDCRAAPWWVLQHEEFVLGVIFGMFLWLQSPVFVLDHGVCFMLCMVKVKVTLVWGGSLAWLSSRDNWVYWKLIIKVSAKIWCLQSWSSLLFEFHPRNHNVIVTAPVSCCIWKSCVESCPFSLIFLSVNVALVSCGLKQGCMRDCNYEDEL